MIELLTALIIIFVTGTHIDNIEKWGETLVNHLRDGHYTVNESAEVWVL